LLKLHFFQYHYFLSFYSIGVAQTPIKITYYSSFLFHFSPLLAHQKTIICLCLLTCCVVASSCYCHSLPFFYHKSLPPPLFFIHILSSALYHLHFQHFSFNKFQVSTLSIFYFMGIFCDLVILMLGFILLC
jgi:hypothetical protein